MLSVLCSEGVTWAFPGGCLGVSWGLGGVNLSEPPTNSQERPIDSSLYLKRVYNRVRWNEIKIRHHNSYWNYVCRQVTIFQYLKKIRVAVKKVKQLPRHGT